MDLGGEGLDARDHYLLETNPKDLKNSAGEDQHYWLLQILAARRARTLREEIRNNNSGRQLRGRERAYFCFSLINPNYRDHGL